MLLAPGAAWGQNHVRRAMDRARMRQDDEAAAQAYGEGAGTGAGYLRMKVENGDTVYLGRIRPVYIVTRGKKGQEKAWREYYRLVWRFARVYPYALASKGLKHQVDSTLDAQHYGFIRKERYISAIQDQLFKDFEGALRQMSIQQGAVLLKLIDRETGVTSYDLIKNYKNGIAAGFWQGIAKIFENDLKSHYDPEGADRQLEELVRVWDSGEFPSLYWAIFGEDPPQVKVPESYLR